VTPLVPAGAAGPAGHTPRSERPPAARRADRPPPPGSGALDLQAAAGNSAVAGVFGRGRAGVVRSVLAGPGRPVGPEVVELVRDTTGADASGVTVHEGPEAAEAADAVGASMFASGRHIVAPGGLDVTTREGVFRTVHEVHHVVNQQAKGPVDGTDTGDGLRISDPDDRFEREADAVAAAAVAERFF
jgi:hypothetical protein